MMMQMPVRLASVAALAIFLVGCGSSPPFNSAMGRLRAEPPFEVTPSVDVSVETAAVAGALLVLPPVSTFGHTVFSSPQAALLYVVYDPLAPNWSIKEQRLNEDTYVLSMRAKSFRTGGDGEAMQVFKRRAQHLQHEKGYTGYRILNYSEGVESSTPLTHRVSEGTVKLVSVVSAP